MKVGGAIVLCLGLLFGVGRIKVWRTLDYGCLLGDEALEADLALLRGELVSIRSSYGGGDRVTVGYRGMVESAEEVLKEISSAGGLIWRDYAAGSNFDLRVREKDFRVEEVCAYLPLAFPTWKLVGATDVKVGLD